MLSEHDQKLLKILASEFRIKHYDEGWRILKNDEIVVNHTFKTFEDAVDFIFDKQLIKE